MRIGLCLDSQALETSGIAPKGLRSINPKYAKNERDARYRAAKREQLLRQLRKGNDFPHDAIYPNLGEKWGQPSEQQIIVPIPASSVRRLGEKIVRGISYIADNKFIIPPYTVEIFVIQDERELLANSVLDQFGQSYAREPGIVVYRAVSQEDAMSSIFKIEIWQQFKMYASVYDRTVLP